MPVCLGLWAPSRERRFGPRAAEQRWSQALAAWASPRTQWRTRRLAVCSGSSAISSRARHREVVLASRIGSFWRVSACATLKRAGEAAYPLAWVFSRASRTAELARRRRVQRVAVLAGRTKPLRRRASLLHRRRQSSQIEQLFPVSPAIASCSFRLRMKSFAPERPLAQWTPSALEQTRRTARPR